MRWILLILLPLILLIPQTTHAAGCMNGTDGVDDNITCTTGDTVTDTPHGIDAGTGNNTITVDGSASITGTTGDGILSGDGNDIITIGGTATVTGNDDGIQIGAGNDTVTVSGSAQITGTIGIYSDGIGATKSVTITDNAQINATLNSLDFDATTTDTLTISGAAVLNGGVNVFMRAGDDRVVLAGNPLVIPRIDGGAGNDELEFNLTVPPAELAAVQAELATKNANNDSIVINGNTYTWVGFETLVDNLTAGTPPTPTPAPVGGVSGGTALFLDNRINRTSRDIAPPVAVYQTSAYIDVYAVDPFTSVGTLLIRLDIAEITALDTPATPVELGTGTIPATGRPVTVYLLPSGEVQLNSTFYQLDQWKPYVIVWRIDNPAGLYHLPS